jgi:hypothetical protein
MGEAADGTAGGGREVTPDQGRGRPPRVKRHEVPPRIAELSPLMQLRWLRRPAARRWVTRRGIRDAIRLLEDALSARRPSADPPPSLLPLLQTYACSYGWAIVCNGAVGRYQNVPPLGDLADNLKRQGVYPPAPDHPLPHRPRTDQVIRGELRAAVRQLRGLGADASRRARTAAERRVRDLKTERAWRAWFCRMVRAELTVNRPSLRARPDPLEENVLWPFYYVDTEGKTFELAAFWHWKREGKTYDRRFYTSASPSAQIIQRMENVIVEGEEVVVDESGLRSDFQVLPEDDAALVREIRRYESWGMTEDERQRRLRVAKNKGLVEVVKWLESTPSDPVARIGPARRAV